MNFRLFSEYLSRIEVVSSRLEMTNIIAALFGKCGDEEVAMVCYLMAARVAPLFVPIEFNVAEKTLTKAAEIIVGKRNESYDVVQAFGRLGDIGEVVEEYMLKRERGKKSTSHSKLKLLSLRQVYDQLWAIALQGGSGSSDLRQKMIVALVNSVSPLEAKYILRILSQKLRLGASSKTLLDALSVQKSRSKRDRDELERTYGACADLGYIARVYMKSGVNGLKNIRITPGVPAYAMLVEREKDAESIVQRINKAIVQPKFDGIRCQIHIGVSKGKEMSERVWWHIWQSRHDGHTLSMFGSSTRNDDVKLFSRNLEDLTAMFPDIVEAARSLGLESAVFDAEIVGYNEVAQKFVPFQETMTRKRKYNVLKQVLEVPVCAFVFDVLYLNGEEMVHKRNDERIDVLSRTIGKKGLVRRASSTSVSSAKALKKLFTENIRAGLEGIVIKDGASVYEPGVRSFSWIKLKRASRGHLADSLDVVILGYYRGRGKQAVLGIGALLAGVYNPKEDAYSTVTKIGTGISEVQWKEIKHDLDKITLSERPAQIKINKNLLPDVWVKPEIVVTVEADEITRSPIHTVGVDKNGVGFALRFPRLKVWKRDRLAEDTNSDEVIKMFTANRSLLS